MELDSWRVDPEILKRADVAITTYEVLRSEHKAYTGVAAKSKAQAEKHSEDDSGSDDSMLGKSLKKKAAPKRARKTKAKLCALFEVKFWRIVLGATLLKFYCQCSLTRPSAQMRPRLSRIEHPKLLRVVLTSPPSIDGS